MSLFGLSQTSSTLTVTQLSLRNHWSDEAIYKIIFICLKPLQKLCGSQQCHVMQKFFFFKPEHSFSTLLSFSWKKLTNVALREVVGSGLVSGCHASVLTVFCLFYVTVPLAATIQRHTASKHRESLNLNTTDKFNLFLNCGWDEKTKKQKPDTCKTKNLKTMKNHGHNGWGMHANTKQASVREHVLTFLWNNAFFSWWERKQG